MRPTITVSTIKLLKSSYCVLLCQIYGGLNIYFFPSQFSLRDYLKKNLSKLSNKKKKNQVYAHENQNLIEASHLTTTFGLHHESKELFCFLLVT